MGPLSSKLESEISIKENAAILAERRKLVEHLNNERRKQEAHVQSMAIKAATAGVPRTSNMSAPLAGGSILDKAARAPKEALSRRMREAEQGFADGTQAVVPGRATDVVPARLSPGEAVIPASAAQLPQNRAVINRLVQQGRELNQMQRVGQLLSPVWEMLVQVATGNNGQLAVAKKDISSRKSMLDEQERRALGYSEGTTGVGTFQQEAPLNAFLKGTPLGNWLERYQERVAVDKAAVGKQLEAERGIPSAPGEQQAQQATQVPVPPALAQGAPTTGRPPLAVRAIPPSTTPPTPAVAQPVSPAPQTGLRGSLPQPQGAPKSITTSIAENDVSYSDLEGLKEMLSAPDNADGQGFRATKAAARLETELGKTLKDPGIRQQLLRLEATAPPPDVDKGDWLAKGISGIFGPTGLFSQEELIRFGIVAAGGLITGGSVGGSLRFAGLDALRQSTQRQANQLAAANQEQERRARQIAEAERDQREVEQEQARHERGVELERERYDRNIRDATAAATASKASEAAKDVRERYQAIEGQVRGALDERPRAVQEAALKLMQRGESAYLSGQHEEGVQYVRAAHAMLMAAKPIKGSGGSGDGSGGGGGDDGGFSKLVGHEAGYLQNGTFVRYARSKDGKSVAIFNEQTGRYEPSNELPVRADLWHAASDRFQQGIAARIKPILAAQNSGKKDYQADDEAKRIAAEASTLSSEIGYRMRPDDAARIMEMVVQNGGITNYTPEKLRRVFQGTAIVALSPSKDALYYTPPKRKGEVPKPPTPDHLVELHTVVDRMVKDGNRSNNPAMRDAKDAEVALEREYQAYANDPKKAVKLDRLAEAHGSSRFLAYVIAKRRNQL